MTLLDAYALIAFLVGGPASAQVRGLLREGGVVVASANLAESLDVCQRRHGLPVARAMEVLEPLLEAVLNVIALDTDLAREAAELRARHYHRTERPISLADAVLLATAGSDRRLALATADPDVLAVAQQEGMDTLALPGQG